MHIINQAFLDSNSNSNINIKRCSKCKSIKRLEDFVDKHRKGVKILFGSCYCKDCRRSISRVNSLKSRGTIVNQVIIDKLILEQNNSCAICGVLESKCSKKLHVDHDHKTGIVRGLLCSRCNAMIGMAKDEIGILIEAISYLTKSASVF